MSDLEDLIAIAGASPGDASAPSEDDLLELVDAGDLGAPPIPLSLGASPSPERADLAELVEMVSAEPPPKKYKNRSWEHAKHARDMRKVRQAESLVLRQEERRAEGLEVLSKLLYSTPGAQSMLYKLCGG